MMELEPFKIHLPEAEIYYVKNFIPVRNTTSLFEELLANINWRQDDIKIFGKTFAQPRLTALYGNPDKPYSYSNIKMEPNEWTPTLLEIKSNIEKVSNSVFTTVLLNLYRDGSDSNGWHADNEKELGKNPVIASISLGGAREFQLRNNKSGEKFKIVLESGSLLLMAGQTQHTWKHQIPKTKKHVEKRINLTYRNIVM